MPGEKYVYTYDLHLFDAEKRSHQVVDIAKYPDQEVKVMLLILINTRNIFILPVRAGRVTRWIFAG
ncbi:MAG: hypothetical protein ACLU4J_18285 [Butyricimonas paravirosa]